MVEILKSLFIRDGKNVRVWAVTIKEELDDTPLKNSIAIVTIQHGIFGNKLQVKKVYYREGKNVGKANATTPYEQAVFDYKKEHENKRNDGYKLLENLGLRFKDGFLEVNSIDRDYSKGVIVWGLVGIIGNFFTSKDATHEDIVGAINQVTNNWRFYYTYDSLAKDIQSTVKAYNERGKEVEAIDLSMHLARTMITTYVPLKGADGGVKKVIKVIYDRLPALKTDLNNTLKPMILHHGRLNEYAFGTTMYKKSKIIRFPCYAQPKKDGVCAVVKPGVGLITREGKDRLSPRGDSWNDICPQIKRAVDRLSPQYPLHGEVFLSGYDLQTITSACQKKNLLSADLQLHIFDIVDLNSRQEKRLEKLEELYLQICELGLQDVLKVVPKQLLKSYDDLLIYENFVLGEGEEGFVVRHPDGKYLPGTRSSDVLKIVRFDSSEVIIEDIIPMENEPTHGMFIVRMWGDVKTISSDDKTVYLKGTTVPFRLTPSEFTHQQRIDFLMNKEEYIGKILTITHRGYTNDGLPRIATAKSIRLEGDLNIVSEKESKETVEDEEN